MARDEAKNLQQGKKEAEVFLAPRELTTRQPTREETPAAKPRVAPWEVVEGQDEEPEVSRASKGPKTRPLKRQETPLEKPRAAL